MSEPRRSRGITCCDLSGAIAWVEVLASDALAGDRDASGMLPLAIEHWLRRRMTEVQA